MTDPRVISIVHHPQGWPGLLAGLDHGALHRTGEWQLTKNKLLWWIRFLITSIVMGGASGGNILPSSWVFRCQVWDRFAFILNVILYCQAQPSSIQLQLSWLGWDSFILNYSNHPTQLHPTQPLTEKVG